MTVVRIINQETWIDSHSHLKIFAQNSRQNSGLAQNGQNFSQNLGRITQNSRAKESEEYEGGF